MHQAFGYAAHSKLIPANPINRKTLILPRKVKAAHKILTPAERAKWLAYLEGHEYRALGLLLTLLGPRIGEALALKWDAVDFERGTVQLGPSLQRERGGLKILPPKTEAGLRTLRMGETLAAAMKERRRIQLEHRIASRGWGTGDPQFDGLVFTTSIGTPHETSKISVVVRAMMTAAGITARGLHQLRHTAATHLLGRHVPLKGVQRAMGHATASMTLDLYGHTTDEMMDAVEAAIEE
jgi:integrase